MEKNVWSGEVTLPPDRCNREAVGALVTAMDLYVDNPTYGEQEDPMQYLSDLDDDIQGVCFDPQCLAGKHDGCADYFDADSVEAALVELRAVGSLVAYADDAESRMEFEALGETVRKWYQPEDAMMSHDLPEHVRIEGVLYQLTRQDGSVAPK